MSLFEPNTKVFNYDQKFRLESAASLPELSITFTTYGELSPFKDNVIWVFHALTANSDPAQWWPGLVGKDQEIDPARYFIVCVNTLGSCYGTTGPANINPSTGQAYGTEFPFFTIRDIVKVYQLIQKNLGIDRVFLGIGGSMGGQQLLEWAIIDPDLFQNIFPIATNARHSAWGIAFNESQRLALLADPSFNTNAADAGKSGLKAARAIAMLSYRNAQSYEQTQTDIINKIDDFKASTYQDYQGEKLVNRFNAHSYFYLGKAMDSHNVDRDRSPSVSALTKIRSRTLIIGINSDMLFTPKEQFYLAEHIGSAELIMIDSIFGHDGFLVETEQIAIILRNFLHNSASERLYGT